MVYLSENGKALISILLLDLDKHTYLMLQAEYKDKLNNILYKGWLHNIGQNTFNSFKSRLKTCLFKKYFYSL